MINLSGTQKLTEPQEFKEPLWPTIYVPFIDPNAPTNPNRAELKNLWREAGTAVHQKTRQIFRSQS